MKVFLMQFQETRRRRLFPLYRTYGWHLSSIPESGFYAGRLVFLSLFIVFLSGCQTPEPAEKMTAPMQMVDGNMIREVADKMMRSLLNSKALTNSGVSPRIALIGIRNYSRFPFDGNIFLVKLRADLNTKAEGRIIFLSREHIQAIRDERHGKRSGKFSFRQGSLQDAISGADYFLTGELRSLSGARGGHRSEYIHFRFFLVNAENTDILWEDQFEIDFKGRENVVYR